MANICKHPFNTIQIQLTGEVYCCCCYWTDFYSFGNIFEQSFDEIWNGQKAQKFRKQFIENNYKYCKIEECSPYLGDIEHQLTCEYPKQIEFSYDRTCNVRCVFCRPPKNKEEEEYNRQKRKFIEDNFEKIFTPILEKAELVELNSAGELFASKHSLELMKKIIKINPNIKFRIISNGILFTKEAIDKLGIKNKISAVTISIHSITEKTYNKIVEGGNFKALIDNIKYLSELKQQGFIDYLQLNFVVTGINYKEMKKFVQFAKSVNAKAFFIDYHEQISSEKLTNLFDISKITHPKHNELIRILKDPIFKDECCVISNKLLALKPKPSKLQSFFEKLFKK